MITMAIPRYAV